MNIERAKGVDAQESDREDKGRNESLSRLLPRSEVELVPFCRRLLQARGRSGAASTERHGLLLLLSASAALWWVMVLQHDGRTGTAECSGLLVSCTTLAPVGSAETRGPRAQLVHAEMLLLGLLVLL
jgi:hypothetical protein